MDYSIQFTNSLLYFSFSTSVEQFIEYSTPCLQILLTNSLIAVLLLLKFRRKINDFRKHSREALERSTLVQAFHLSTNRE